MTLRLLLACVLLTVALSLNFTKITLKSGKSICLDIKGATDTEQISTKPCADTPTQLFAHKADFIVMNVTCQNVICCLDNFFGDAAAVWPCYFDVKSGHIWKYDGNSLTAASAGRGLNQE